MHRSIYLQQSAETGFVRYKIKPLVAAMVRAGRGLMLQGKLSDCDPFSVSLPFSAKSALYPLGEGLLVMHQELMRMVVPKCDQ